LAAACGGDSRPDSNCRNTEKSLALRGEKFLRSVRCSSRGESCDCDLELARFEWRTSGRFTIASTGRLSESGAPEAEYCAQHDELLLRSTAALGARETVRFVRR
jgi:hypothetical protein